jgi:hypothetical protein
MIKIITVLVASSMLSGCGYIDRLFAKVSGGPAEVCHDQVVYLQFTSGVSVKYNTDGSIALCHK